MSVADLLAEHGSPLWLADVDRARERLAGLRAAWSAVWPETEISYSYKTNRTTAFLRAFADDDAAAEVVCAAELERLALAGVTRAGLRVGLPGPEGHPSRFGIAPAQIVAAARRARELGLALEALSVHLVSTDFTATVDGERTGTLAAGVRVAWAKPPAVHAQAASTLARLATAVDVSTIDLGGGFPAAPAVAAHAAAVAGALHAAGFSGRVLLEPGRALVADAVDLAMTVVAVKTLADGTTCAVVDAGTDLLPGALWAWPRLTAPQPRAGGGPTLVAGPLCLNIDVVAPAAELGEVLAGDLLIAHDVGAYQQVQSTQFGDGRPAVVARDGGTWRLHRRREQPSDLIIHDREEPSWSA